MILPDTMRILVVDDNVYARAIAHAILMQIGVKDIVEAGSGAEAIGLLLNDTFDVMLADWYMPEMNGAGLVRVVRSPGFGPSQTMPIVVMTAYATRENIGAARALGIAEILIKPIDQSVLASTLIRAASTRPARHDSSDRFFLGD
jgi:two-component system, chemotaxis family, chemotaxis protein CheY